MAVRTQSCNICSTTMVLSRSYISQVTLVCSLMKQAEILTLIAMKNSDSNIIFKR
jgi:hypothetical protein